LGTKSCVSVPMIEKSELKATEPEALPEPVIVQ
jgi:hypothetical protein